MDADLLLIFGFVLAILLIVLTFGTLAGNRSRTHKLQRLELEARIAEAKAGQAATGNTEHRQLEERIRVLERIATDGNHALASQIDELRDLQEIEDRTMPQGATR